MPNPPAGPACRHRKPDGNRCRAAPRAGKPYCTFHDPSLAADRAEGRRKGGVARSAKASTLPPDTPDLPLNTVGDVTAALAEAYNGVRTGRLDARVGNCLGVMAGALLKAIGEADLERRIAALEAARPRLRRTA